MHYSSFVERFALGDSLAAYLRLSTRLAFLYLSEVGVKFALARTVDSSYHVAEVAHADV